MRIGIYTNRFPYPPIGGIPSFLHGIAQTFIDLDKEVVFLLPNLTAHSKKNMLHINGQSAIEATLGEKAAYFSKISSGMRSPRLFHTYSSLILKTPLFKSLTALLPLDVMLSLESWASKGPFNEQQIYPLLNKDVKNISYIMDSCDLLIIAGSVSLLFSNPSLIDLVSRVSTTIFLVLLFPLAEIEFYFGPFVRSVVANHLSRLANLCTYVVVPSAYVEHEIRSLGTIIRPIIRIPHGINIAELYNDNEGKNCKNKNVISISRLGYFARHKNVESLLRAWPLVRNQIPDATLTLIGSGSLPETRNLQANKLDGLLITRDVPEAEKVKLLHQSRVFVLPSSIEAFGFSYFEALAAEVPIIGLSSTSVSEVVSHEKNGLLLQPQDLNRRVVGTRHTHQQPDTLDLAYAIIRVLTDDSFHKKIKGNCLKSILPFDWHFVANSYLNLCKML